jgi:hypothetical protein
LRHYGFGPDRVGVQVGVHVGDAVPDAVADLHIGQPDATVVVAPQRLGRYANLRGGLFSRPGTRA